MLIYAAVVFVVPTWCVRRLEEFIVVSVSRNMFHSTDLNRVVPSHRDQSCVTQVLAARMHYAKRHLRVKNVIAKLVLLEIQSEAALQKVQPLIPAHQAHVGRTLNALSRITKPFAVASLVMTVIHLSQVVAGLSAMFQMTVLRARPVSVSNALILAPVPVVSMLSAMSRIINLFVPVREIMLVIHTDSVIHPKSHLSLQWLQSSQNVLTTAIAKITKCATTSDVKILVQACAA